MIRKSISLFLIILFLTACASFEVRDDTVTGTLRGCPSGKFAITVEQNLGVQRPHETHNVEVIDGKLSFRFIDRSKYDFSQPFTVKVIVLDAPECGEPGTEKNYSGSLEKDSGVFEDVYHVKYSLLN